MNLADGYFAADDFRHFEDRQEHTNHHAADDDAEGRRSRSVRSKEVKPESVVSISSRKSEMRSSMLSILPVCSPAVIMRMIMFGKTGCLLNAQILSPRSMSVEATLMVFP